jgi:hypothetical protein
MGVGPMKAADLPYYQCWIGRTPHEVFLTAKNNGGWKSVFPNCVPTWASKVRNYFNVLPTTLKRLPEKQARAMLDRPSFLPFLVRARKTYWANRTYRDYHKKPWGYDPVPFKPHPMAPEVIPENIMKMPEKERIALEGALSDDVYLDNLNRPWFQMAAGSTIYHWGDHPDSPTAEAVYQDVIMRQNDTPVFKMISPDDNGGSAEVIIFNDIINENEVYNNRADVIGEVNQVIDIRPAVQTDPLLQGSYNYSETTTQGLGEHERRDVKPHVHSYFFYVNPLDPYSPLSARTFPELDRERKPLLGQHGNCRLG